MASTFASGIGCAAPTAGSAISRRSGVVAAALALFTGLSGAAPVTELDIGLDHVRSAKGLIRVCLTADPANFPACVDDADAATRSIPATSRGMRFTGLPRGDYAVAVIHDENGNARLDTFAGIPREGYGFSRNPPARFGAPRFAAARFAIGDGANSQQISMRYIF